MKNPNEDRYTLVYARHHVKKEESFDSLFEVLYRCWLDQEFVEAVPIEVLDRGSIILDYKGIMNLVDVVDDLKEKGKKMDLRDEAVMELVSLVLSGKETCPGCGVALTGASGVPFTITHTSTCNLLILASQIHGRFAISDTLLQGLLGETDLTPRAEVPGYLCVWCGSVYADHTGNSQHLRCSNPACFGFNARKYLEGDFIMPLIVTDDATVKEVEEKAAQTVKIAQTVAWSRDLKNTCKEEEGKAKPPDEVVVSIMDKKEPDTKPMEY